MNITKTISKFAAAATLMMAMGISQAEAIIGSTNHLTKANEIVNTLRNQGLQGTFTDNLGNPLNNYGASWSSAYAVWGPTAKVDAQCASFFTLVMQNSYPGWTARNAGFNSSSPTAAMYFDAITANTNGFTKVSDFDDIEEGDLLFAKYYDNSNNTGHAMIVKSFNVVAYDAVNDIETWSVEVIDCSNDRHSSDSRDFTLANGAAFSTKGAGRGFIKVVTKAGNILGYSWSFSSGSTFYTPSVRELVLGRLSF